MFVGEKNKNIYKKEVALEDFKIPVLKFKAMSFSKLKKNTRFTDLVKNTTNVEYVKLIVSCLDYRSEDSFSRFVLETALSSASEAGRKWATRFLSILAVYNNSDFSVWGIKLLLRQLEDPSAKVVRHAVRLLHRWIPYYPKSAYLIKDVCFDAFGDAGTLLKTHLFSDESYVENNFRDTLTTIDYWKKEFNSRYAEIIDEDVRVALLDSKRSIDGRYARCSNERIAKFGVPMPVHLYGQLAQHDTGRKLLLESDEVGRLLDVLRDSPLPTDAYQISEMKGALYALGHTAAGLNPGLLPTETVPIICRFAECCPVLSIRGAAFWVLNLIGNTKLGSVLLSSLGWESSNFIFTEKKTNDFLLQTANNDISKIWIRCMDWNDSLQHGVEPMNEKFLDIKHKNSELITNKRTFSNLMDHLVYRWKGCGLLSLEAVNCSVGIHHGSTSEVENVLFDNDNISTLQKEGEETEDYFIIRSRFRLRPLLLDKLPTFKNFLGTEVKYSSMSEDEDIFINEELIKHNCDPSSAAEWQHGMNNCLYCSWPEEYFGSKNDLEVGVSTEARNEIISLFLLQGSKQTMSSKILLKNYLSNRENFSSLCLYSDIVALLAQHDYNTETRRLVHELFANALQNVCICEPS
uniref:Rapamycin-insensitive companion of mTOR domain-containing protein n=1 Tax=Setaria digitata TaxID=48799 RepID=A0A915PPK8_9BILA